MSKKTPSPPPAPDPYAVAQAQTGSNVNTAVANTIMGNANERNPYGTVTYNQIGTQRVGGGQGGQGAQGAGGLLGMAGASGIQRGSSGPLMSGEDSGYDIPQWERIVELSPAEQAKYDQQNQLHSDMNNLAINQTRQLTDHLGNPIDGSKLPGINANAPTQFGQTRGNIQYDVGPSDFSADRQRVEAAIMSRAMPQFEAFRNQTESRLANQGIELGSEAYASGVDEVGRNRNDAIMSAILAGGQEQSRMFGMELNKGQFNNAAQNQDYNQQLGRGNFAQSGIAQNNNAAGQALQREIALRNQPINEVTALMSGGQAQVPQFQQYQGGQVAGTPIGQYIYDSNATQQAQFQSEQQRKNATQNAMMGGLFGLGSAGITGGMSMMKPPTPLFGLR